MSTHVLKIIPTDRRYVPAQETHEPALKLLEELAPGETEVNTYENLQYIDAGEALERIVCPRCRSALSLYKDPAIMDWYEQIVEEDTEKGGVESVNVITPCCNANVPFEELEFEEGGFALFELAVWDPDLPEYQLPASSMAELEKALGCALKQVWAHY
jgi:hypothetical protein